MNTMLMAINNNLSNRLLIRSGFRSLIHLALNNSYKCAKEFRMGFAKGRFMDFRNDHSYKTRTVNRVSGV